MKKLLASLAPWQKIALLLAGLFFAFWLFTLGGFGVDEDIVGITKAIYSAPPEVAEAKKQLARVPEPLKTAAYEILESKNKKGDFAVNTAVEASLVRKKWCVRDLGGSGIHPEQVNADIAACLSAHLRKRLGTEDYNLNDMHPDHPGKTYRQHWFDELIFLANACKKASE